MVGRRLAMFPTPATDPPASSRDVEKYHSQNLSHALTSRGRFSARGDVADDLVLEAVEGGLSEASRSGAIQQSGQVARNSLTSPTARRTMPE